MTSREQKAPNTSLQYRQSQSPLIGKVEDRTMKIQTTKRSISGVTPLGLLTSVIAVAWLWYGLR